MRPLYLLAVTLLAACQPSSEGDETARSVTDEVGSTTEAPRIAPTPNSIEAQANGMRGEAAPYVSPEDRWLGRFAATTQLCRGGAWDIGDTRIVTDSGTACDIDRVGRAPQQVTLRLSCTAEGTKTDEEWVLAPEGTERMKVRRNTGREQVDVDLIRCS